MTTPGPHDNRPASPLPPPASPAGPPPQTRGRGDRHDRPAYLREFGAGMAALGIAAVVGVPVGALWSLLTPRVEIEMTRQGPYLTDYQTEAFMGADAVFAILGFAAGVTLAVCGWVWLRRRGPAVLAGLTLGSLAGSWIAWQLGRRVGLAAYRELLDGAEVGWRFYRPPVLRSVVMDLGTGHLPVGVLGVQALTVAIVYTLLAGWSRWPSLRGPDTWPGSHGGAPSFTAVSGYPAPPGGRPRQAPAVAPGPPAPPAPPGHDGPPAPQGSGWSTPGAPARR